MVRLTSYLQNLRIVINNTLFCRLYADNKELWAGMIKDLYDKVELFLSKHNTEEFFQAFPDRRKPFLYQINYLLIWRAMKAVKLLTVK
jgi:hypothetical protein